MAEARSDSSSSRFSLRSILLFRASPSPTQEEPRNTLSPPFVDALQRQDDTTAIRLRVLPFAAAFNTAADEYYLLPFYAKRVVLRRQGEEFVLHIPDVRVEEVEMRLGVGKGEKRLAIECEGRNGRVTVFLKEPRVRMWKELDRCLLGAVDVSSMVLVMLEGEEKGTGKGKGKESRMPALRTAARSIFQRVGPE